MCYISDGDAFSFHDERHPRAKKAHRCGECGRRIQPGEQYLYVFGIFEGDPTTHRICADCEDGVCAWLTHWCQGYLFEGVFEDAAEHLQEAGYHGLTPEDEQDLSGRMVCKWTPESVAA